MRDVFQLQVVAGDSDCVLSSCFWCWADIFRKSLTLSFSLSWRVNFLSEFGVHEEVYKYGADLDRKGDVFP